MKLIGASCIEESLDTLFKQQRQLKQGSRDVQMFPVGTKEIRLLDGFGRHENFAGVFHYNPNRITPDRIDLCCLCGRENEFLKLGPFSKIDVLERLADGETHVFITEYDKDGVELRSAIGSTTLVATQLAYFERTKEPDSVIVVGDPPPRVLRFLTERPSYGPDNAPDAGPAAASR